MGKVHVNDGLPTLLIRDILRSKKLSANDAPTVTGSWFSFKNTHYKAVHVRGVITKLKLFDDKWKMTIDDGTGAIYCSYTPPEEIKEMSEINRQMQPELNASDQNKATNQAALILCRNNIHASHTFGEDFKLGETLEVTANLSEYNGKKYLYIWNLTRHKLNDMDEEVAYFRAVDHLYVELDKMHEKKMN